MKPRPSLRIGFRLTLTSALTSAVLVLAAASVTLVVLIGESSARRNAQDLFGRITEVVEERTSALVQGPVMAARQGALASDAAVPVRGDGLDHPFLRFMEGTLASSDALYSMYVGADDGSFLQLIQANESPRILQALQAPERTLWVLRTITGSGAGRVQRWTFLGAGRKVLGTRTDTRFDFQPAQRPWFRNALGQPGPVLGEPYTFQSLGQPGLTASAAVSGGRRVVGVDLTLGDLQAFVERQVVSAQGSLRLTGSGGVVWAATQESGPGPDQLVHSEVLTIGGQSLEVRLSAPLSDFDGDFRAMEQAVGWASLVLLVLLVPSTVVFSHRLSRIMKNLAVDVGRVCQLDFSGPVPRGSRIREFDQLISGFSIMKEALSRETDALAFESRELAEAQKKLKKIVETGIALSTEKDSNALCQRILDTAKELTDADGGTLYLLNEADRCLDFHILLNDSLGTRWGGTSPDPVPQGLKVRLYREDGGENHHNVASHAFLTGETVNIADAYDEDRFDFSGTKTFDEANGYRSRSFLTVPLKPMGGDVLGCLQLINARGEGPGVVPFTSDMQDFVEALAASAATALYNKQLLDDLEQLFDAIIDIINGAIGRKSPYTGGHCERVPVIATALARATSAVPTGPLAGFRLDAKQLREFVLAAKLHDVGKVSTPEYVVDKSTKLETIYNRIHEIRTRFEVLWRDAVIRRHEAVLADPSRVVDADADLAGFKAVLDEEWAFLAQCNVGGEFLTPAKAERIKTIGGRTWTRYFDDRLGLSWEEEDRLKAVAPVPAPAPATLLSDSPIHIFHRQRAFEDAYETPSGVPYPFRTEVPPVLFNQGEVYNLTISRGTLTAEEYFKIKEHVMQSIYMLDRLPWPRGLERVPVIAGEHHETLLGTGYPFRKTGDELSVQSRILTIADIFEALTASDRPYKKAKTLSESVRILYGFKKDRHIDPDLFDLFLTSGVYLDYAKDHLKPEQIDPVDIGPYLGPVPA